MRGGKKYIKFQMNGFTFKVNADYHPYRWQTMEEPAEQAEFELLSIEVQGVAKSTILDEEMVAAMAGHDSWESFWEAVEQLFYDNSYEPEP
jgi:hypothetical protein